MTASLQERVRELEASLAESRRQTEAAGRVYGIVQQAGAEVVAINLKLRAAAAPLVKRAERWQLNSDDARLSVPLGELRALSAALTKGTTTTGGENG